MRARLPERKIVAQHCDACVAKGFGEGDQQGRVGVRAGSVRQDEAVAGGFGGAMQVALNGSFRDFGGAAHSAQIKLIRGFRGVGTRQGGILNF
jgi:hypothetical protein